MRQSIAPWRLTHHSWLVTRISAQRLTNAAYEISLADLTSRLLRLDVDCTPRSEIVKEVEALTFQTPRDERLVVSSQKLNGTLCA